MMFNRWKPALIGLEFNINKYNKIYHSFSYSKALVISVSKDGYNSSFSYLGDADILVIFFNRWFIQALFKEWAEHF